MCVCRTIASSPCGRGLLMTQLVGAGDGSRPANCDEVERLVEIRLACRAQGEVACGDRRREPAIEGLRQAQARVDPVPAELQRERMYPQLARMEEAIHLDLAKRAAAQCRELLGAVLVHVPRVVRALRPLGRERQDV